MWDPKCACSVTKAHSCMQHNGAETCPNVLLCEITQSCLCWLAFAQRFVLLFLKSIQLRKAKMHCNENVQFLDLHENLRTTWATLEAVLQTPHNTESTKSRHKLWRLTFKSQNHELEPRECTALHSKASIVPNLRAIKAPRWYIALLVIQRLQSRRVLTKPHLFTFYNFDLVPLKWTTSQNQFLPIHLFLNEAEELRVSRSRTGNNISTGETALWTWVAIHLRCSSDLFYRLCRGAIKSSAGWNEGVLVGSLTNLRHLLVRKPVFSFVLFFFGGGVVWFFGFFLKFQRAEDSCSFWVPKTQCSHGVCTATAFSVGKSLFIVRSGGWWRSWDKSGGLLREIARNYKAACPFSDGLFHINHGPKSSTNNKLSHHLMNPFVSGINEFEPGIVYATHVPLPKGKAHHGRGEYGQFSFQADIQWSPLNSHLLFASWFLPAVLKPAILVHFIPTVPTWGAKNWNVAAFGISESPRTYENASANCRMALSAPHIVPVSHCNRPSTDQRVHAQDSVTSAQIDDHHNLMMMKFTNP